VSRPEAYSKCRCKNCGGPIEFPSEGAGSTVACPHCNWPTVLAVNPPAAGVGIGGGAAVGRGRKGIYRVCVVAATVAIASGAGFYRYWYLPKIHGEAVWSPFGTNQLGGNSGGATTNPGKPVVIVPVIPPDPWHGLMAGPITLEKVGDGNLVYAVGKLTNSSDHQRFSVKVDLDIFDAGKQKVGTATDYTPSIDPGKEWKFKALVTDRTAATAKLTSVKEN